MGCRDRWWRVWRPRHRWWAGVDVGRLPGGANLVSVAFYCDRCRSLRFEQEPTRVSGMAAAVRAERAEKMTGHFEAPSVPGWARDEAEAVVRDWSGLAEVSKGRLSDIDDPDVRSEW